MRVNKIGYIDNTAGPVKILIEDENTDFVKAKDIAKQKAAEFCAYPLMLSWFNGTTGEYYPTFECGSGDKPAWIVYAEARGADIWIDVNDGDFVFSFLSTD